MQTIDRHMQIEYPDQLTIRNKKENSNKKPEKNQTRYCNNENAAIYPKHKKYSRQNQMHPHYQRK